MRKIFNKGCYLKRFLQDEFDETYNRDKPLDNPPNGMEKGTRSQGIYCFYKGKKVAFVHLYRTPDGDIGASGKPDPKMVKHNGRIYRLKEESL